MPDRIPSFKTKTFLRACRKLGLIIDTKAGKGSHVKVIDPKTNQTFPVPKFLPRGLQIALIKHLETWGHSRENFINDVERVKYENEVFIFPSRGVKYPAVSPDILRSWRREGFIKFLSITLSVIIKNIFR